MLTETTTRHATLTDLAEMLKDQQARKVDIVTPSSLLRADNGDLVIRGAEAQLDENGVTTVDGRYRPTSICDEGIAAKLGVPLAYLRRLRSDRPDLYDANLNGWLHGAKAKARLSANGEQELIRDAVPADPRSFLVRCFRGDDGGLGVARAFLSDSYRVIDHLDALTAALDGVRQSGVEIDIDGCDLTDRQMYVRVKAPAVSALAPTLLEGYKSPFSGASGADNPTVFAGFVISNSETGNGSFSITPRLIVEVCNNGMTITKDAVKAVHLGGKMDDGVIRWSEDTQRKQLELITSKARDAVATFLDTDYIIEQINSLEKISTVRLTDSVEIIESVGKRMFTEEQTKGILDHFIISGDITAGGVLHAVTSFARTVDNADTAAELEASAFKAMELAAAAVK